MQKTKLVQTLGSIVFSYIFEAFVTNFCINVHCICCTIICQFRNKCRKLLFFQKRRIVFVLVFEFFLDLTLFVSPHLCLSVCLSLCLLDSLCVCWTLSPLSVALSYDTESKLKIIGAKTKLQKKEKRTKYKNITSDSWLCGRISSLL